MTARFAFPHSGQQQHGRTAAHQAVAEATTARYAALAEWQVGAACTALLDRVAADARQSMADLVAEHPEIPGLRAMTKPVVPRQRARR